MMGLGAGDVWAFGHTHWNPGDLTLDFVRVVSNQKGRDNENTGIPFRKDFVMEIDCAGVAPLEGDYTRLPTSWRTK